MIWLWIWGIVTAFALIIEFLTADLITIWFAAGGLATLFVVSLAPGLDVVWQLVIFVGVSTALLLSTRKICLKLLNKEGVKTNVQNLIGKKFVIDSIENDYTYHNFNGVYWRVYAIEGETLKINAEVEIVEVSGNKLIAKNVDKK